MRDVIISIGLVFITVLVVIVLFVSLLTPIQYINCHSFEVGTNIETKFSWGNCYAEVGGKFVPVEYVFGNAHELRVK